MIPWYVPRYQACSFFGGYFWTNAIDLGILHYLLLPTICHKADIPMDWKTSSFLIGTLCLSPMLVEHGSLQDDRTLLQLGVVAESWECEITTKHFRYLNGGILTYISCMDTACILEHPPPKNSLIRFSTSVLGTWHVWWDYHQTILMNESIDDRKDNPYQPNHPMSTWLSWSIHCQSWIMSTPWLFDDSGVL